MLRDQAAALARVDELVDREDWRVDKRTAWTAMLRRLVFSVDWQTGLVSGLTRAHLAAAGDVGLRTVTSLLAWARHAGLLVEVESGASAAFLGTDQNRAPSYVLTVPPDFAPTGSVDTTCDLPASSVGIQPLGLNTRHDRNPRLEPWPLWDRPETPADRLRATMTLLERIGLDRGRVVAYRAHGLLTGWWTQGACIAGLLHALDHHPDQPVESRGDALRAARDPLAVLGHRLTPWRGRLHDLPASLHAVDGAARRRHVAEPRSTKDNRPRRHGGRVVPSSPAVRAAARATVRAHFRRRPAG